LSVVAGQVEGGTAATLFLDFLDESTLTAAGGAVVRSRKGQGGTTKPKHRTVVVGLPNWTHAQWMRDREIVTFIRDQMGDQKNER